MNSEQTEVVVVTRAQEVADTLLNLQNSYEDNFFSICELLLEVNEKAYYAAYGFAGFDEWVENSGLEMSSRNAYYFLKVAKVGRQLGLTKEQLKAAKISKLKEIFSLDPKEFAAEMKQFVIEAAEETIDQVRVKVAALKGLPVTEAVVYLTLKVTPAVKETVQEAIELARRNYGDTVDGEGNPADISTSKAIELIMESFLQDENNYPQESKAA